MGINTGRLTDAQQRARDWIPADGSWKLNPGRLVAALNSLSLAWSQCVEQEWGDFGPRGGRCQRWRLTEEGVRMNIAVELEG